MRLKHIIKEFEFNDGARSEITLGANLTLTSDSLQIYTFGTATDAAVSARSRLTSPGSCKRWMAFYADVTHKKSSTGVVLTSIFFRLSVDGITDLYWNGTAFIAAAAGLWNTESEISQGIASLPIATQSIQVIAKLASTVSGVTPELRSVKVLYESDVEHLEDYIWRSLIADMEAKVQPIADFAIQLAAPSATINLATDYKMEAKYNIVSIDSVYDTVADPRRLNNLLLSYDATSQIITLNAPAPANNTLFIRFIYSPTVVVTAGRDFTEHAAFPNITIEEIREGKFLQGGKDFVVNKSHPELPGKVVRCKQIDLDLIITWNTALAKDYARIGDELKRYFANNPLLRSIGMDDDFRLWLFNEPDQMNKFVYDEIHTGRLRCRIANALFYDLDAVDARPVTNFQLIFNKSTT